MPEPSGTQVDVAPDLPFSRVGWLGLVALSAAGYFVGARLGTAFMLRPAAIAVVWPPNGLLLALLILLPKRRWPVALVGGMLGNIADELVNRAPMSNLVLATFANALEVLVAAWVVIRLVGPRIRLDRLREVGALVLGAVIVSNAVTALVGALQLMLSGNLDFPRAWFVWWTGDGMGMLLVAPVALTCYARANSPVRLRRSELAEAGLLFLLVGLVGHISLSGQISDALGVGSHPYLVFPLIFWAAVRFGPWGAATAVLVLGVVTLWNASNAIAVFAQSGRTPMSQVLEIYSYLGVASLSGLLPAAILKEHAAAEAGLRESEERFREMAEYVQESFLILDVATGERLYVSPMWATIWGRSMEEGYHPTIWFDAIVAEDRAKVRASVDQVKEGNASVVNYRVQRPDGTIRWVRSRAFPVRDGASVVRRAVAVSEDITELRQIEVQLLQSQKMEALGQLAGGVAHDFNNLLTVILAETEFLENTLPPEIPRGELREIQRVGERAALLTRQLLAFSRRQLVEPVVFELNELVLEMATMLGRLLGEHIHLRTHLSPEAGSVRADRGQIEQVIANLAVNARDAMPRGGTLTLRTTFVQLDETFAQSHAGLLPGEYVMLTVSDTGSGMTEDVRARVFEPFFTTKPQGKGTGLGLATSYGIMQQADGQLSVYSEVGVGTMVRMHLPRAAAGALAPVASIKPMIRAGSETILLVEDEEAVRRVTVRLLEAEGYRIIAASDANDAHRQLEAHPERIDLLLTDVMLPGVGGRELAEQVSRLRPEIRVLYASGYTDDAILAHGLLEHDVALLEKPFTRESLRRKVREVLDAPSGRTRG